jgi:hypothetical protein
VYRKAVDAAADELCLRVRVCIEEGLGVDDLVGVVTGESTPQVFPRDHFREFVGKVCRRGLGRTAPFTRTLARADRRDAQSARRRRAK